MSDLMQEYIERGMHELAKKEREGIEYILRNLIDDPITGDITIEKLMERNIISFVYDKQLPPTKMEEQGNKMVFTIHSDFFGIRQGAYIVRPNGERVEIDYQVLANTRQDFIDYSRQGT